MTTNNPMVQVAQPRQRAVDADGVPIPGAKIFTYVAGTTTKMTTYADPNGLTPNTNPIIADADGWYDLYIPPLAPFNVDAIPQGNPGPPGVPGVPGPPGPTGNTAEFSNTVDIPSETIYGGWYGEYIDITADPASVSEGFVPVGVVLNFHYRTAFYAMNSANIVLNWGPPTFPSPVPNGSISASFMEAGSDKVVFLPIDTGLAGETVEAIDIAGKRLTLTLDAAPDGPPLIAAYINTPGTGYATDETFEIGDTGAIGKVVAQTAGVPTEIAIVEPGEGSNDLDVETAAGGDDPGSGTGLTVDTISAETTGGTVRVTTFFRKLQLVPA